VLGAVVSAVSRLRADVRGAVAVEIVVALLPVLMLGAWVWQTLALRAGELVVRRAADAAARAAAVVLPDDPTFYEGETPGRYVGARRAEIERAAALVLSSSTELRAVPEVELSAGDESTIEARVSVRVDGWFSSWAFGGRTLTATASAPYQGARFAY
jgi:Flp pilus assembly protein TadG